MNTKELLLKLLAERVPTGDYVNAENVAVLLENDYGTLTDLRNSKKYTLRMLEHFAEAIDKLARDVEHIKRKPAPPSTPSLSAARLACVEGRIEASVCCTPPFNSLNR